MFQKMSNKCFDVPYFILTEFWTSVW